MRLGLVSDCVGGGDKSRQQKRLGKFFHNWVLVLVILVVFSGEGVDVHSNLSDSAVLDVLAQR